MVEVGVRFLADYDGLSFIDFGRMIVGALPLA